ncbi:hypothetical protein [Nostoc sp. DSM 114159]
MAWNKDALRRTSLRDAAANVPLRVWEQFFFKADNVKVEKSPARGK